MDWSTWNVTGNTTEGSIVEDDSWNSPMILTVRVIVFPLLSLITVAANSTIVYLILFDAKIAISDGTIFASMAIADLLTGGFNFTLTGIYKYTSNASSLLCMIWCIVNGAGGSVSLIHVLAISIIRVRAIVSPLSQMGTASKNKERIWIPSVWCCSFMAWTLYFGMMNSKAAFCKTKGFEWLITSFNVLVVILPLFAIVVVNVHFVILLRKRKANSLAHQKKQNAHDANVYQMERDRRAEVTLAVTTAFFLLAWMPMTIEYICIRAFSLISPTWLYWTIYMIYNQYSTIQPFLLVICHRTLRDRLRQLLVRGRHVHPVTPS